jgi:hypothetical protein
MLQDGHPKASTHYVRHRATPAIVRIIGPSFRPAARRNTEEKTELYFLQLLLLFVAFTCIADLKQFPEQTWQEAYNWAVSQKRLYKRHELIRDYNEDRWEKTFEGQVLAKRHYEHLKKCDAELAEEDEDGILHAAGTENFDNDDENHNLHHDESDSDSAYEDDQSDDGQAEHMSSMFDVLLNEEGMYDPGEGLPSSNVDVKSIIRENRQYMSTPLNSLSGLYSTFFK